jgi:hypothetical protein
VAVSTEGTTKNEWCAPTFFFWTKNVGSFNLILGIKMAIDKNGLIPTLPLVGNLVEVRKSKFIVKNIEIIRPDVAVPSADASTLKGPQHKVTLASLDDEAIGQEITVYWEKEPGARVEI